MITINLLPPSPGSAALRRWLPPEQRPVLVGLGIVVAACLGTGGAWYSAHRVLVDLRAEIAAAENRNVRLGSVAKLAEIRSAEKADLNDRLRTIETLSGASRDPLRLLEAISRSLPGGLWLMELKQVGSAFQIEGRALSIVAVTDFADNLRGAWLPHRPVDILSTNTESSEGVGVVRFTMKLELPVPKEPFSKAGT